ncbi:MAG: GntR family transcriptional regulator [Thermoanaerobaculia bacterium]
MTDLIRQRIVAGEHLGALRPGQRLPGIRTWAAELDADPRVVLRAYGALEREGLVEVRRRSGVYLSPAAGSRDGGLPWLAEFAVGVLAEALQRGMSPVAFLDELKRLIGSVRLHAVCVECNADQMTGLCGELGDDYGFLTTPVEIAQLASREAGDAIRRARVVVTTHFHASEVQPVAAALGKRLITISLRPEFLGEIERLAGLGLVYFIARDPRFAEKLLRMMRVGGRSAGLRVLIAGEDDPGVVPPGAPLYVTRAARAVLRDLPNGMRIVPSPRVFSNESIREILAFVLAANGRPATGPP